MTSITITTVGYGEVVPIQSHINRDILVVWTIALMWVGMGVTLYAISTVTTFLVGRNLQFMFQGRKMFKIIQALIDHTIHCGLGNTDAHVATELCHFNSPFIVM